jgi:CRP/FNR family transcriptional regulator, nitrogen oxide reductase regulator
MKSPRKKPLEIITTPAHLCTVELRLRLLGKLPFFADLPAEDLEAVNQKFREVGFQVEEYIYHEGDPAADLFVIAEGMVRVFQIAPSGRRVLLDILAAGDFFGNLPMLGAEEYTDTAQAQTPACVLRVGADPFQQILNQYPGVTQKVLGLVAHRLQAANERVFLLSSLPVERRIAFILLKLAGRLGQEHEVGLLIGTPLSRENLAEMAGTTPESASRVMSQFQKEGLIAAGREWVALKNPASLQALVDEEPLSGNLM